MRSAELVVEEIETLITIYGVRNFTIVDDLFLFKRARAVQILNMIIERQLDIKLVIENEFEGFFDRELIQLLAKAGCVAFGIAVESGNLRVLKKYTNKPVKYEHAQMVVRWAREENILTTGKWIIGFPDETWEEIRETFRRAEEIDCDYNQFSIATPLPGTALTRMYIEQGSLPKDFDFNTQNIIDIKNYRGGYISTPEFDAKELQMLRCLEWDRINFTTPEKTRNIAKILHMSLNELARWRKDARKSLLELVS
jgi:magnesium-protoporphyrin IX monomethyl ester (oxidative) cyclase